MDAVDMRPETVNLLVGEEVRVIPAADAHVRRYSAGTRR